MAGAGEQERGTGPGRARPRPQWQVREATLDDADLLFRWRHDEAGAGGTRSGSPVPWAGHLRWLASSVAREDRVVLIVSDEVGDVGTVRWDERGPGRWEVSITVAPERRGRSLARPLLAAGEAHLSHGFETTEYLAVVHVANTASQRLFGKAGYLPDLPADERGFLRLHKASAGSEREGQS